MTAWAAQIIAESRKCRKWSHVAFSTLLSPSSACGTHCFSSLLCKSQLFFFKNYVVIDWKRQSHGNLGDIYENHKIHVQNLIWIDTLTFVLFYGSCFLLTLLCSSTK